MLATIRSLGVKGIGGYGVSVEVFVSNGLVNFDIVVRIPISINPRISM